MKLETVTKIPLVLSLVLSLVLAVTLIGCTSQPPRVITKTVTVDHYSYLPIDPQLLPTIQTPTDPTKILKNGQLWNFYAQDNGQLGVCKGALDGIRGLQGKAVPWPGAPVASE